MLYYLAEFRDVVFAFNVFKYITFRAGMAAVTTFLICVIIGPAFIRYMKQREIRERAKRDDCPTLETFHKAKEGTPTMGGILIVGSILFSVLLWADLSNHFIIITLITCLYLAVLGVIDDWVKLTQRHIRGRGLSPRTKFLWQILLGCFIGSYVYHHPATMTNLYVPFSKTLVINLGILYLPFVALVVIGTTNAVNLTDGLDGLATGLILIVSSTLAILCYISGHKFFSEYLFIPYVIGAGELTVFCAAIAGASLGFLWFNCHPASIFMGDIGSLSLGGTIAVISIFIKKELLLLMLGGVFAMETLSVILQITSFKLRRKRIFRMSPFHHHLQLGGWNESKIIVRFWIIGIILALLTLVTLKVR